MNIKNILLIVFILLLLYIIIRYIMKDVTTLTSITSAKTMQTIAPSKLATLSGASTSNFCYSIWFYIDDWNYRYGEEKVLFGRMESGTKNPLSMYSSAFLPSSVRSAI